MSKRSIITIIEATEKATLDVIPVEVVLDMLRYYMDEPSLFNFCATTTKYRDLALKSIDLFAPLYTKLTGTPSLYKKMYLHEIWSNNAKFNVRDNFALWYALKFRALFSTPNWSTDESVIAFNGIALSLRKLAYFEHLYATYCIHDIYMYTIDMRPKARYPTLIQGYPDLLQRHQGLSDFVVEFDTKSRELINITRNPENPRRYVEKKVVPRGHALVAFRSKTMSLLNDPEAVRSFIGGWIDSRYNGRFILKRVIPCIQNRMYELFRRYVSEEPADSHPRYIYMEDDSNDDSLNDEDAYDVDENGKLYDISDAAAYDERMMATHISISNGDSDTTSSDDA